MDAIFEYAELLRIRWVENLGEFEAKVENTLGLLSGAQLGFFGQITSNRKISCKCIVPLLSEQERKGNGAN